MTNNQWFELIEEYDRLSKHRTIFLCSIKSALKRVRKDVREQWNKTIANNRPQLSQADDFNDLYERLDRLKIPGIGPASIMETATRIAEDYNIPIDDSCWACHCLRVSRTSGSDMMLNALEEAEFTPKQKIDFIFTFKTQIRRLLK